MGKGVPQGIDEGEGPAIHNAIPCRVFDSEGVAPWGDASRVNGRAWTRRKLVTAPEGLAQCILNPP